MSPVCTWVIRRQLMSFLAIGPSSSCKTPPPASLPTPPSTNPPRHPRHRPSRLTQAGLRSSLQSADSGGQVLNASPLLVLQGSAVTLPPRYQPASGGCGGRGSEGGVERGRLEESLISTSRGGVAQERCANYSADGVLAGGGSALPRCHGIITPSPLPRSPAWHYHHRFE